MPPEASDMVGQVRALINRIGTIAGLSLSMILVTLPSFSETVRLEPSHGVFTVPVRINDTSSVPFIVDTGASNVVIPMRIFQTLTRAGTVNENDFIETISTVLADGSVRSADKFRLRKVIVADHVITNVVAIVLSGGRIDPLLGQSFLSRLPAWTIDNDRHVLVLDDKLQAPNAPLSIGDAKARPAFVSQATAQKDYLHTAQEYQDPSSVDLCPPPHYHKTPIDGCQPTGQ